MELLPASHRDSVEYGWRVPPEYSPSAIFAWIREADGVERPAIYSFPRRAWLTAGPGEEAVELPAQDQQQLARLLAPNLRAVTRARLGHLRER
jgi:hypothetical protein